MAISVRQVKSSAAGNGSTTQSASFTSTPLVGSSVIVIAQMKPTTSFTAASDNQGGSNHYSVIKSQIDSQNNGNVSTVAAILWCPSIVTASGTFTVTVTTDGTGWMAIGLIEATGVGSLDQIAGANDGGTSPTSITVTAPAQNANAGDLVVCVFGGSATGTIYSAGPTSGYTGMIEYNPGTQGPSSTGGYKILSALETSSATSPVVTGGVTAGVIATFQPPGAFFLVGQPVPTTGGTNNLSGGAGGMFWHVFTAYASGTATALNIYISSVGGSNGLNLALYDVLTGQLLGSGSPTLATGLCTVSISATIVYGRQYALVYQGGANNGSIIVVDDNTNNQVVFATNTAGSFPSTLPSGTGPTNLGVPSMYVSGNLAAGASGIPLGGARTQWHWR